MLDSYVLAQFILLLIFVLSVHVCGNCYSVVFLDKAKQEEKVKGLFTFLCQLLNF